MWDLEQYGDNIAVIEESARALTYRDVLITSNRFASQISQRCLIFCLCSNRAGSLIGYVGSINHGIVPLLLDAQIEPVLLSDLMETYKPDYLWAPAGMEGLEDGLKVVYSDFDYILIKTPYSSEYPLFADLALLLTTSGSTGSRKLVRQSYGNVSSNMETIANYLEIDATERSITTLPMNYTYGLSIVNSHLFAGACLIMTERSLMQKEFWLQLKELAATSFGGVPYTYEMLNRLRFVKMELPSLRTLTQAGGKLLPELHDKFARFARDSGRRFYVMYGQAEATARMSYLPWQRSCEKVGSIGIAIPGGSFTLIDESGRKIAESDVEGELVYEGPNVTLGYAEQGQDLAGEDENRGRLVTGDIAQVDSDGYYWIVGRKKRFLKIFGNRVNLDGAEQLLKARFGDMELACGGVDDRMYIFITDGQYAAEVRQHIIDITGLNRIAFTVKVIDQIPKNESGKTRYAELDHYYN